MDRLIMLIASLVRSAQLLSFGIGLLIVLSAANVAYSMTSENLPAENLPTPAGSRAASATPGSGQPVPTGNSSPAAVTGIAPAGNAGVPANSSQPASAASQSGTAATPGPGEPPPALDASTVNVGPDLGNTSLDPEISQASTPALAASLRLTEDARKELDAGGMDEARRKLARAVSIDPANAFAYYYLGRAYLLKKNYRQALTFFRRAEVGFQGRADWSAEALVYQGICAEELGEPSQAMQAYQQALAASPNNLMARVGYGRLAPAYGPVGGLDTPPPGQNMAPAAPAMAAAPAPSEQPPPPPPDSATP